MICTPEAALLLTAHASTTSSEALTSTEDPHLPRPCDHLPSEAMLRSSTQGRRSLDRAMLPLTNARQTPNARVLPPSGVDRTAEDTRARPAYEPPPTEEPQRTRAQARPTPTATRLPRKERRRTTEATRRSVAPCVLPPPHSKLPAVDRRPSPEAPHSSFTHDDATREAPGAWRKHDGSSPTETRTTIHSPCRRRLQATLSS
jgi:hypothetical protein